MLLAEVLGGIGSKSICSIRYAKIRMSKLLFRASRSGLATSEFGYLRRMILSDIWPSTRRLKLGTAAPFREAVRERAKTPRSDTCDTLRTGVSRQLDLRYRHFSAEI